MEAIAYYVHVHLAGAAAGIDLFGRSGRAQTDREIGDVVLQIREQLIDERRSLRAMADRLQVGESSLLTWSARAAERVGRLKPNGDLLRRTPLTDLVELEAMRDAVAGKIAGWQALLAVADDYAGLDRAELDVLLDQGEEQHRRLTDAHAVVAARVLTREV